MVVLDEHDRSSTARRRRIGDFSGGLAEALVDHPIAVAPGVEESIVDARLVRQLEELMLQEPEERIGDDRIMGAVGVLRYVDEVQIQILVARLRGDDLAQPSRVGAILGERQPDRSVGGIHRCADPGDGREPAELCERGDETTRSARRAPVAGTGLAERQWATIRDDDHPLVGRQETLEVMAQTVGLRGQSRAPAASRAMSKTALVMGGTSPMTMVRAAAMTSPTRVDDPTVTDRVLFGASRMYM